MAASPRWAAVRDSFDEARYAGVGAKAFPRWWAQAILKRWIGFAQEPLVRLSAQQRVERLTASGLGKLSALKPSVNSPGDKPWQISISEDPVLRLPSDLRFSFSVNARVAPWIDEPVWCLEQAKRNRSSPQLAQSARERLALMLQKPVAEWPT